MARNNAAKAKGKLIAALASLVVIVLAIVTVAVYRTVTATNNTVVTIGLVGNADDDIWKAVQQELDRENAGITVKTKAFQDGIYANKALADGELDLNAFQHYAFLNDEKKQNGYRISAIGETYVSPLNLYSKRYDKVSDFKPGDKIAIPNNPTNTGRALKVLDSAGLIKLKDITKDNPTVDDIASSPSGIEVELIDVTMIINLLPDYAGGVVNMNFVIDAGMSADEAVYADPTEPSNEAFKPYVNVIVARDENKDTPAYRTVVKAYHTKAVGKAIVDTYKGALVPVFEH